VVLVGKPYIPLGGLAGFLFVFTLTIRRFPMVEVFVLWFLYLVFYGLFGPNPNDR
jgi:hypothetical protein